jgi:hypothetical protein
MVIMSQNVKAPLVFISYARADGGESAAKLDEILQRHGFNTWRDTRGINPAKDFTAEIERAIKASDFVVTCITRDVNEREDSFVRREVQYALVVKKPVIVVRFHDVPPPINVINNTWVNFCDLEWELAFEQLESYLRGSPDALAQTEPQRDPFRPYVEWLYSRMVTLLDKAVIRLIDLDVEDDPEAVTTLSRTRDTDIFDQFYLPFGADVATTPGDEMSSFHNFADAFEHYDGRLLLLGAPGAGKSVTLMAAARDAAARRLSDMSAPLPLWGIIATWDAVKHPPMHEWLAARDDLIADDIKRELDSGRALLLLDGLDELGGERDDSRAKELFDPRQRFLDAIPESGQIIVSCRELDYAEIGRKASLNGAITLQPLDESQMRAYLRDDPDLLTALEGDVELRTMLQTPLIMSLFAFAYREQGEQASKLRDLSESPRDLRDAIIGAYVEQRYAWEERKRGVLSFTLSEIRKLLGYIASHAVIEPEIARGVFRTSDIGKILDQERADVFLSLAIELNLLIQRGSVLSFSHSLICDHFALRYALAKMSSRDAWERMGAAQSLGWIGDVRAFESLIQALEDSDKRVRGLAARSLGRIGDKRSVGSLVDLLRDSDSEVRSSAIWALGELRDSHAIKPILKRLKDREASVRYDAARALGKLRDPRVIKPLAQALNDKEQIVRRASAEALTRIGTRDALKAAERWYAEDRKLYTKYRREGGTRD